MGSAPGAHRVPETPLERGRYVAVVKEHVDTVLRRASDRFGTSPTPLLADTLEVATKEPYIQTLSPEWSAASGHPPRQILFNFALYQQFHGVLQALSRLTGDDRYRAKDEEITRHALTHLEHPNGLLMWGNHCGVDLLSGSQVGGKGQPHLPGGSTGMVHELQDTAPDYAFLFRMNPEATRRQIESHWGYSIRNWERLDFGRHLGYSAPSRETVGTPPGNPWDNVSRIDPNLSVPFGSRELMNWSNAGNELIYSAFAYWKHTGDERAWRAGELMLKRFMDMRHPQTHLSPFTYGWSANRPQERESWTERVAESLRTHKEPLFMLRLAEVVGPPRGDRLRILGIEALLAYARHLHVPGTNRHRTHVALDGTVLGDRTTICSEMLVSGLALGYRVSGNPLLWETLREIMAGYEMGDIGMEPGRDVRLAFDRPAPFRDYSQEPLIHQFRNNESAYLIHAFVDLYAATWDRRYLQFAAKMADQLIEETYEAGLFVRMKGAKWARTTAELLPMALLRLEAAIEGRELEPSSLMPRILYYRATDANKPIEMAVRVRSSRIDMDHWLFTLFR